MAGSEAGPRRVVLMGAGGRDFHNFNTVFRDDPASRVVAFTAAQIPGIDGRTYPPSLAGPRYPHGVPIVAESELAGLAKADGVDEVVLAYSDLSHEDVMHKASLALSLGADFRLLGPAATMLRSSRPVVAVCAVRTGCGKSQTTRRVGQILVDAGLKVAVVRHPMPYGDLERMRVQRFATLADIDAAGPTVEEREEYEAPVRMGITVFAGVDYGDILREAEREADVVVWDGGNNDFPFYVPDLQVTVADPLRAGHELAYHPGETNLRMADVVVVNKVDSAYPDAVEEVVANVRAVSPAAVVIHAESPVTLEPGPSLAGRRVLVVEDDPSIVEPLADGLRLQGYEPVITTSGQQAVDLARASDVVLLDLGLPDLDGLEVCRRIRRGSDVPIIMVSARDDELDRVMGLELGADDYVVKPFSMRELVARIRAHVRRLPSSGSAAAERESEQLGPLRLDRRTRRVTIEGEPVHLTAKEFDLLAVLLEDAGAVVRREDLMSRVWDINWFGSTKTLDVHVGSLRNKLGDTRWIETVRSVGYRAVEPS